MSVQRSTIGGSSQGQVPSNTWVTIIQRHAKRMNHRLWLTCAVLLLLLFASIGGFTSITAYNHDTMPIRSTVQNYYQALLRKDYVKAYQYFTSHGTILDAQGKAEVVSVAALQDEDLEQGLLLGYTASTPVLQSRSSASIKVNLQRRNNNKLRTYDAYVQLVLTGTKGWLITSIRVPTSSVNIVPTILAFLSTILFLISGSSLVVAWRLTKKT
jgi:hypothetical protein